MKFLKREKYLEKIRPFMQKSIIKVLVGQRRVGKSFLLQAIADELKEKNTQIIFIDKEGFEFDHITDYLTLNQYILSEATESQVAILIDEVQEIKEFEKSLRNFYKKPGFDIYITGSNANLMSGELATILGGRYLEVEVHPLDYKEYLELFGHEDSEDSLANYLQNGGMPGLSVLPEVPKVKREYLQNIFNSIVYKDIIRRNQIRNVVFLENLIDFLADNIGSQLSATKISDYLKSQKIQLSINTVLDYLQFISDSFVVRRVQRQDIKGKKIFEVGEKYYFEDLGLRNSKVGFSPADIGKVYENAVFNHLKSNGYEVRTGTISGKEIDFIAEKDGEITYIQVAYQLIESGTLEREFGNLLLIQDNYRKCVVSSQKLPSSTTYKGIEQFSLRTFLMHF